MDQHEIRLRCAEAAAKALAGVSMPNGLANPQSALAEEVIQLAKSLYEFVLPLSDRGKIVV